MFCSIVLKENKEKEIEAIFDAIRNRFAGKDVSLHFIDKDFGLDNAANDPKLEELRETITEVAKQQSYWGELKPAKWIPFEKLLEDLRSKNIQVVRVSNVMSKPSPLCGRKSSVIKDFFFSL